MLLIDADRMADALAYPRVVEALRIGHRAGVDAAERLLMTEQRQTTAPNHLLIWPGWQYGGFLGAKLVSVFPSNATPVPSIQTVYVLFDGQNGTPLATIQGAEFTLRKTAADSALAASFLAKPEARRMVMVGAGNQAPHQIRAHCAVRPSIAHVEIWNRSPARAQALADALDLDGVDIGLAKDLESAVRQAEIICCATAATRPLLRGEWLSPGSHVDLVGGFTSEMREADDETIRRANLFVDSRWFTISECGDVSGPIAAGIITESDIKADLFDLCAGRHAGRQSTEEITVFKNAGGAHLDLMMAELVYNLATGG